MKKVLFAGLLAIAGVSVSAQNLIKNEKFATEVKLTERLPLLGNRQETPSIRMP